MRRTSGLSARVREFPPWLSPNQPRRSSRTPRFSRLRWLAQTQIPKFVRARRIRRNCPGHRRTPPGTGRVAADAAVAEAETAARAPPCLLPVRSLSLRLRRQNPFLRQELWIAAPFREFP